jgi:N-acetyl-anhydromuramyl-L-alanine amidase AmpD
MVEKIKNRDSILFAPEFLEQSGLSCHFMIDALGRVYQTASAKRVGVVY